MRISVATGLPQVWYSCSRIICVSDFPTTPDLPGVVWWWWWWWWWTGPARDKWVSLKTDMFDKMFFGLGQYWRKFLRSRAQIAEIFGEILSQVEKMTLLVPYFRLFQWRLSTPHRWAPRAAVRLACTLIRLWWKSLLLLIGRNQRLRAGTPCECPIWHWRERPEENY